MNFIIQTTTDPKVAAEFLAGKILGQLEKNKKVLWLVPGGSAMAVAVEAAKIISKYPHNNLTITLTDERYGVVGHKNSNWQQLIEKDFILPQARLLPVLYGESCAVTTEKFNTIIGDGLKKADYRIGLFGIGADGHTAGILPDNITVESEDWVTSYKTPQFERITIMPKTIEKLDEAITWAQGEQKWGVIESLKKDMDPKKQPAQLLKKVPALTIFTDFK